MKFITETEINPIPKLIEHSDRIISIGPCFAEEISGKFYSSRFQLLKNPFGIIYNPFSIQRAAAIIASGRRYAADDLIFHNGLYQSIDHHGDFSHPESAVSLELINKMLDRTADFLPEAEWCIITLGTAWYFRFIKTGTVAANCHRFPADSFSRLRMSVSEASEALEDTLNLFRRINPDIRFIFTVSPVRHWRDGFVDNTRSKAVLHLAVEDVCKTHPESFYFPSYELLMDDLRDYRFYKEDMFHPNDSAVDYIWEKFSGSFISKSSRESMDEVERFIRALEHRPRFPGSGAHAKFIENTRSRLEYLRKKYPFLDIEEDMKKISDSAFL